ncbi:MAG: winged helix-turn-helix transcriptional regulator [Candidatus Micrarchaeota archaeon]|nr:winged helix-turn-helix transcriptional regulator [Candidatus Micrarchaeota archaeon]
MGKTFETKRRILQLLKSGNRTPTEIYKMLNLAPSTVSQHLKELKEAGQVEEYFDEHFRNIKYYGLRVQQAHPIAVQQKAARDATYLRYGMGAIIIIAILGIAYFALASGSVQGQALAYSSQPQVVQMLLTDPPHVPNGTTSLLVSYSALALAVSNSSGKGIIKLNSSGKVDLMGLINASTLLSNAKIPANTAVQAVAFDISNASITISGTTYPLLVSKGHIVANVTGNSTSTNSTILLDFSPTVAVIYTNSSPVFVLVPSIRTIRIPGIVLKENGSYSVPRPLNITERMHLEHVRANITISNASLSTGDNITTIHVTVTDNSNQSVTLEHLFILGNETINLNLSTMNQDMPYIPVPPNVPDLGIGVNTSGNAQVAQNMGMDINTSGPVVIAQNLGVGTNASGAVQVAEGDMHVSMGMNDTGSMGPGSFGHAFIITSGNLSAEEHMGWNRMNWSNPNDTILSSFLGHGMPGISGDLHSIEGIRLNASAQGHVDEGISEAQGLMANIVKYRVVAFFIGQNGTLTLPELQPCEIHGNVHASANSSISHVEINCVNGNDFGAGGYTLAPGKSVTLTFTGHLAPTDRRLVLNVQSGARYKVTVMGNEGAYATANVTAG